MSQHEIGYTTRGWLEELLPKLFSKVKEYTFEKEVTLAVIKVALNNKEFDITNEKECDTATANVIKMVKQLTSSCK